MSRLPARGKYREALEHIVGILDARAAVAPPSYDLDVLVTEDAVRVIAYTFGRTPEETAAHVIATERRLADAEAHEDEEDAAFDDDEGQPTDWQERLTDEYGDTDR